MDIILTCFLSSVLLILLRLAVLKIISRVIYTNPAEKIFTHNSENSIEFALRSALCHFIGRDVTVYDSGSCDDTAAILEIFKREHCNIKTVSA